MSQQFTKLNKRTLDIIEAKMLEALKGVESEMGIKLQFKGGQFQKEIANLKLEVVLIQEDGTAFNPEENDFRTNCFRYGLKPSDLGQTFTSIGKQYKIIGAIPRNHRYPIITERQDGKRFKFPVCDIKEKLGKKENVSNISMTTFGE